MQECNSNNINKAILLSLHVLGKVADITDTEYTEYDNTAVPTG